MSLTSMAWLAVIVVGVMMVAAGIALGLCFFCARWRSVVEFVVCAVGFVLSGGNSSWLGDE